MRFLITLYCFKQDQKNIIPNVLPPSTIATTHPHSVQSSTVATTTVVQQPATSGTIIVQQHQPPPPHVQQVSVTLGVTGNYI